MGHGMMELELALALVLVVEGLTYAIFPEPMQRMMRHATALPPGVIRYVGLAAAALGVFLVWLIRR